MICVRCLQIQVEADGELLLERIGAAMTVYNGEAVCLSHYDDLLLKDDGPARRERQQLRLAEARKKK